MATVDGRVETMNAFPIVPIPDPPDDNFDEPVCEECEGSGYIMTWNVDGTDKVESGIPCDCQREEEDE